MIVPQIESSGFFIVILLVFAFPTMQRGILTIARGSGHRRFNVSSTKAIALTERNGAIARVPAAPVPRLCAHYDGNIIRGAGLPSRGMATAPMCAGLA